MQRSDSGGQNSRFSGRYCMPITNQRCLNFNSDLIGIGASQSVVHRIHRSHQRLTPLTVQVSTGYVYVTLFLHCFCSRCFWIYCLNVFIVVQFIQSWGKEFHLSTIRLLKVYFLLSTLSTYMLTATCCSFGQHNNWLYLGDIITIHLCHGRLVSPCVQQQTGNKLATILLTATSNMLTV